MSIEKAYNICANQYDTNENRTRDLDKKSTIEILNNYEFEYVVFNNADLIEDWKIDANFADLIISSLTLEHIEDLNHIFDQANYILLSNIQEVKHNMKRN